MTYEFAILYLFITYYDNSVKIKYIFARHLYLFVPPFSYENDIAIIKLRQSATFTKASQYQNVNLSYSHYIWPICMPPIDTNWENYTGVVIGTYKHTHPNTFKFIEFCFIFYYLDSLTSFSSRLGYSILYGPNFARTNEG